MRVGLQVGPSAVENLLDTTKSSPHGRGGTPGSPSPAHRARDTSKKHGAGTGDPSITETGNGPLRGVARTASRATSAPNPTGHLPQASRRDRTRAQLFVFGCRVTGSHHPPYVG